MNIDFLSTSIQLVPFPVSFGLALAIGLLVGSFINVVVYRVPRGLSVSKPRSFCPTCKRRLTWWENVPVVSWAALRGRCRTCRQLISIRYPLLEVGTSITFGLIAWARHGSVLSVPYCLLGATIIAILVIDAGDMRSPLIIGALGTALADVVLIAICVWTGHWSVLSGAEGGTLVGIAGFYLLRHFDTQGHRRQGCGQSALIPAGCWLGGLGIHAAASGMGVGMAIFLACIVFHRSWGDAVNMGNGDSTHASAEGILQRLTGAPVIASVAFGTTVGLIVFA